MEKRQLLHSRGYYIYMFTNDILSPAMLTSAIVKNNKKMFAIILYQIMKRLNMLSKNKFFTNFLSYLAEIGGPFLLKF